MSNAVRWLPLILAGWILCAPGTAQASETTAVPVNVRSVYALADLGSNVDSFCTALMESSESEAQAPIAATSLLYTMSATSRARWLTVMRELSDPAVSRELHLAAFGLGYDAESARQVTDWLTSKTGQRILQVEKRAHDTNWDAEASGFVDQIVNEPVPVDRVALFERLDAAVHATDDAADLQTAVTQLMIDAAVPLMPSDVRPTGAEINALVAATRSELTSRMRAQQSIIFLYVYRDTTDEDLAAYVAFAETDAGRWLFSHHRLAMMQLVGELRESLQERLAPS